MTDPATAHRPGRTALAAITVLGACLALGVAIWLIPASVHVVSWTRQAQRVAVFGPMYTLARIGLAATAAAAALVLVTWRRPDRLAHVANVLAPLNAFWIWTLPYWPWVGDRWPLVLVLAGPLRWAFAVLAVLGCLARFAASLRPRPLRWMPGWRTAAVVSFALYAVLGLRSLASVGLGGDEPHYLVIAHSLLADGDLKIENNHARRDYESFFSGNLRPDYLQRGRNGEIYSIHAPGLAALIAPGYLVWGAKGALLTAAALSALAGVAVLLVAMRIAGPAVGWVVWAAVTMTVPFVPHAWALYPEVAGAAVVAWAMRWWIEADAEPARMWAWRGAVLAVLPWFHTKFSVFLGCLTAMLVVALRTRWRAALACLAPIALSGIAWLGFFVVVYGTLDPQAPYGAYAAQFVRIENLPRSLLGTFFDQKFGLLVYAPVYGLAALGLWWGRRSPTVIVPALVAVLFILSSARLYMWWGGSSAPARFLVPVVPLLAPALALAVLQATGQWWAGLVGVTVALSVAIAAFGVVDPRALWLYSVPHGFSRLLLAGQGSAPLAAVVPTFTELDWRQPAWLLLPWLAALGAAIGASGLAARIGRAWVWTASAGVLGFILAAALLVGAVPANVRAASSSRGTLALLNRFDPIRARAFDYTSFERLSPAAWQARATIVVDRATGRDLDSLGRVTDALALPPGRYAVQVWFEGIRPGQGALDILLPGELSLRRVEAPLANPTAVTVDLPVGAPEVWVRLTDRETALRVRRVHVAAEVLKLIDPPRRAEHVRAIEPLGENGGHLAYLDHNAFPEHGVFWTRGTEQTTVLVAPAGAGSLRLVLHVGPSRTRVSVSMNGQHQHLELAAEETREVVFPLPHASAASTVALTVRADAAFIPARVDSSSADTRRLGCQVRIVLE